MATVELLTEVRAGSAAVLDPAGFGPTPTDDEVRGLIRDVVGPRAGLVSTPETLRDIGEDLRRAAGNRLWFIGFEGVHGDPAGNGLIVAEWRGNVRRAWRCGPTMERTDG